MSLSLIVFNQCVDKLDAKIKSNPIRLNAVLLLFQTMGKIAPCLFIENAFHEHFDNVNEDSTNDFIDRICRLSFTLKNPEASEFRKKLLVEYATMDLTGPTGLVNMCDTRDNLSLLFVK